MFLRCFWWVPIITALSQTWSVCCCIWMYRPPPLKKKMVIYASKSHSIWGKALPKIRLHFQLVTAFNIHIQTSGLRLCRHLPCYWHLPPVSLAHTMQIVVLHEFIFTGNDADLWSVFVHFACIFFFFYFELLKNHFALTSFCLFY